jgi:hypothetical protein
MGTGEPQADRADHDEKEAAHAEYIGWLAEQKYPHQNCAGGANAGPDCIGGGEWNRFERQGHHHKAQAKRRDRRQRRPQPREAGGIFEPDRPGDLEQPGQEQGLPSVHVLSDHLPSVHGSNRICRIASRVRWLLASGAPCNLREIGRLRRDRTALSYRSARLPRVAAQ